MRHYQRIEEWRITQRKDGCVFRTVKVRDWYLDLGSPMPKDAGDTKWCPTSDRTVYNDSNVPGPIWTAD